MTFKETLPSFSEQLAVVYDDYMSTLGGGERSALAYALALKNMGFSVEILCRNAVPTANRIREVFGDELASIAIRQVAVNDVYSYLRKSELSVFVNHTFMSFTRNPARLGIYSQMFPVSPISRHTHSQEVDNLATYQLMLCNSSFTSQYTLGSWDYPAARCHVVHPPIGREHIDAALAAKVALPVKKRQFVHIGRFNPGTHNKNQKIIIETFLEARARSSALNDWHLHLIGNSNPDAASQAYLHECLGMAESSGGSVQIHQDASVAKLQEMLRESYGYVHATGAFLPPGVEPFKCEHLGLSIVEGMANACIPLVYARGGIFDILVPGDMGIPYITREGLIEGYGEIAALFATEEGRRIQLQCVDAAAQMGQEHFTAKLATFVARGLVK